MSIRNTWLVSVRSFLVAQARSVSTAAVYLSGGSAMVRDLHSFMATTLGTEVPYINSIAQRVQHVSEFRARLSVLLNRWNTEVRRIEDDVTLGAQAQDRLIESHAIEDVSAAVVTKDALDTQYMFADSHTIEGESAAIVIQDASDDSPTANDARNEEQQTSLASSPIPDQQSDGQKMHVLNLDVPELVESSMQRSSSSGALKNCELLQLECAEDGEHVSRMISNDGDLDSVLYEVRENPDVAFTIDVSADVSVATTLSLLNFFATNQCKGIQYGKNFRGKLAQADEIKKKMDNAKKQYAELMAAALEQLNLANNYKAMLDNQQISPGSGRVCKKRRLM